MEVRWGIWQLQLNFLGTWLRTKGNYSKFGSYILDTCFFDHSTRIDYCKKPGEETMQHQVIMHWKWLHINSYMYPDPVLHASISRDYPLLLTKLYRTRIWRIRKVSVIFNYILSFRDTLHRFLCIYLSHTDPEGIWKIKARPGLLRYSVPWISLPEY